LNENTSIYGGANDGKVESNPVDSLLSLYIDLTCGNQDKFPLVSPLVKGGST
jgi:hypothetical protein